MFTVASDSAGAVVAVLVRERRRHLGDGRRYQRAPHMAAITDAHGRIMVLMTHNTDIADSWEREGEDPRVLLCASRPNGYAVGMNVALYAMTH